MLSLDSRTARQGFRIRIVNYPHVLRAACVCVVRYKLRESCVGWRFKRADSGKPKLVEEGGNEVYRFCVMMRELHSSHGIMEIRRSVRADWYVERIISLPPIL